MELDKDGYIIGVFGDCPSILKDAGQALFGERWQTDISRALGVNDRTVRRWHNSTHNPPAGVIADLKRLLEDRIALLNGVVMQIEKMHPGPNEG